MVKRYVLLSALALVVIVLSILGYFSLRTSPTKLSPLDAISQNALAILRINDYESARERLLFNNLMWEKLLQFEEVGRLDRELRILDSLIRSDDDLSGIVSDIKPNISFYNSGNGLGTTFLISGYPDHTDLIKNWLMSNASEGESYGVFEEIPIQATAIQLSAKYPVYFAELFDLLIISSKPDLVEDAIHTIHEGNSIRTDSTFNRVEKTTGDFSYWNLLVNYGRENAMKLFGLSPQLVEKSKLHLGGWTALDATLHPDLCMLNGFMYTPSASYLSLYYGQKSQDLDVIDIMPENVSLFFHFGVSNYSQYASRKKEYFKTIGLSEAYDQHISEIREKYHFGLEEELNNWIANEFGTFYLSGLSQGQSGEKVVFFRLSDKKRALNVLHSIANTENQPGLDNHSRGRIPIEGLLDHIDIEVFSGLNKPYYTVVDKYLLFCNDEEILEFVKTAYTQDETLKKSEFFASFTENLTDQSNVFLYANLDAARGVYSKLLDESFGNFLQENSGTLKNFEHIGIQFKDGRNDMFYQHTAIDYNPNQESRGNLLWELAIDTAIDMKPQIVYNHYTNAREIFLQDLSNKVYLIDNKGNILWSKRLKEPIKSKVYQIDALKNNKLQILFSGESSIYLIDRKGRDVEGFPVQLPAVTTNGLSVLDYEKNREYRILVAVRGGKILNYDRFGKPVKGWNFKANEEIIGKVDYFLLNGKDYLVTLGSEGSPFVLNRRGEVRVSLEQRLPVPEDSERELFNLELSNDIDQCKFVTADATGNFVKLSFNGQKEIVNLELFSEDFSYLYDDLNSDQKSDYVVLDSNRLVAFDHNRQKLFEVNIDVKDPTQLSMYRFDSGYGQIGFTDRGSGKVYLYRDAGGIHEGFPLEGTSPFTIIDLNKDGRYNLIVGKDKLLRVYNME